MAGRYVPPALRNRASASTSTSNDDADVQLDHSTRRRLSELKMSPEHERPLHTLHELNMHYGDSLESTTLHDAKDLPNKLAYVVLYRGANPRWYTDHIIFAKTHLRLLPGYSAFREGEGSAEWTDPEPAYQTDHTEPASSIGSVAQEDYAVPSPESGKLQPGKDRPSTGETAQFIARKDHELPSQNKEKSQPSNGSPHIIPTFLEIAGKHKQPRRFVFHGYFRLARINFLTSQSEELVRMLEQKWAAGNTKPGVTRQRDPEKWAQTLKLEWAVIQMGKIPRNMLPGDPQIELLPEGRISEEKYDGYSKARQDAEARDDGAQAETAEADGTFGKAAAAN